MHKTYHLQAESVSVEEMAPRGGIKPSRLKNLLAGQGQPRLEDIKAIAKAFPEYEYWLVYGKTLPESGQIRPDIKETAIIYKKTAGDSQ